MGAVYKTCLVYIFVNYIMSDMQSIYPTTVIKIYMYIFCIN